LLVISTDTFVQPFNNALKKHTTYPVTLDKYDDNDDDDYDDDEDDIIL
jgi:hypothetical protein